jgi:hypothetical protein
MSSLKLAIISACVAFGAVTTGVGYLAKVIWKEPQWGIQSGVIAGILVFTLFLVFVKNPR